MSILRIEFEKRYSAPLQCDILRATIVERQPLQPVAHDAKVRYLEVPAREFNLARLQKVVDDWMRENA